MQNERNLLLMLLSVTSTSHEIIAYAEILKNTQTKPVRSIYWQLYRRTYRLSNHMKPSLKYNLQCAVAEH